VLGFADPLPGRPRRVLVAGVSGAGKSTLAHRVAGAIGAEHVELDALFHGPGWRPRDTFVADVRSFAARERWVTEWQYDAVRPLLTERADLLVWLDLPFATVVLPRLVGRTVRRRLRREVLWNGNVEPPLHTLLTDHEHVVRWAVVHRDKYLSRVPPLEVSHPHLTVVRLRSRPEVDRWVDGPLRVAAGAR